MSQEHQIKLISSSSLIGDLINHLNKGNFQKTKAEIQRFIDEEDCQEAELFVLCRLFSTISLIDTSVTATVNQQQQSQLQLIGELICHQLHSERAPINFPIAIEHSFPQKVTLEAVEQFIKLSGVNKLCECVIYIGLTHSARPELFRSQAQESLKRGLYELIQIYLDQGENIPSAVVSNCALNEFPASLQQHLLINLEENVDDELIERLLVKLRKHQPIEKSSLILTPILHNTLARHFASKQIIASDETEKTSNANHNLNELSFDNIYTDLNEILNENQVKNSIMDTNWPKLILEIGYEFTSTLEECKNHLRSGSTRELQAQDVAKTIGLMCRRQISTLDCNVNLPTPANFLANTQQNNNNAAAQQQALQQTQAQQTPQKAGNGNTTNASEGANDKKYKKETTDPTQTWKPDVFVAAIKELLPQMDWKDVCSELDHKDFIINDRSGLDLLLTIFRLATQKSLFPHPEIIYSHWKNVEGQLSLIVAMLKNSDLFSFADFIFNSGPTDQLKVQPDPNNKEINTWKSQHLVEVLIYIGERGFTAQIRDVLKYPATSCPDLLFMNLLHMSTPSTPLRHEILVSLLPTFLTNHPNSVAVLSSAWNSSNPVLRSEIMHTMTEWYTRGGDFDQSKLARILDLAQDLKALSSLLNLGTFSFVLDLACLASRREYLKLDKWLSDKMRDNGEPFIQAMVKVLQRRCPQVMSPKIPDDQLPLKQMQLQPDTVATMMACLQAFVNNVQKETADIIIQMATNCTLMASKARSITAQQQQAPLQGLVPPQSMIRGVHRTQLDMAGMMPNGPPPQQVPFSSTNLTAQQMFNMDGITSNIGALNLGAPSIPFSNMINNITSTPASPSRLLNPGAAQYPLNPMQIPPGPPQIGRMMPPGPQQQPMATNNPLGELNTPVSKEVEDEANAYFHRIYNQNPNPTITIDDVLNNLQRFKDSNIRREQEVFLCMLRSLFEEYRFFGHYPEKELMITAQLFGGIIERNLVPTVVALGLSLRCVLDALRKPEGTKLFAFGITALDKFKTKLHGYSKYCEHIRSIEHYADFPPHLMTYVDYGAMGQEPPTSAIAMMSNGNSIGMPVSAADTHYRHIQSATAATAPAVPAQGAAKQPVRIKPVFSVTNIDTLLIAKPEVTILNPPDSVQDRIAFIFNNLSQINLEKKGQELKEVILKDYWPWLAQYLVQKRATMEPNFHPLYSSLLDVLSIREIDTLVRNETLRNIRTLLRSEKGNNYSDRSLLKNLGHWLGLMTLAQNMPILQDEIDLKALIYEANRKGLQELMYVVPFVAKILVGATKSKVFNLPNPWTAAMLNVLGELHDDPDLKLNLKFEIEVLCKSFHVDVKGLRRIFYLKDPKRLYRHEQMSRFKTGTKTELTTITQQANVPATTAPPAGQQQLQHQQPVQVELEAQAQTNSNVPSAAPTSSNMSSPNTGSGVEANATPAPVVLEPHYSYYDNQIGNMQCLAQYIVVAPNILPYVTNMKVLRQGLLNAIERTITDWLHNYAERMLHTVGLTTEVIVRKDFAFDHDENRMRSAAYNMARNLASSLAMITAREQLYSTLHANLYKEFQALLTLQEAELVLSQLANDNLEITSVYIQKIVAERAGPEVDRKLVSEYEKRRTARKDNKLYIDQIAYCYQSERLPELVRVKSGQQPPHLRIAYTEYMRKMPGFQPLSDQQIEMLEPKPLELTKALDMQYSLEDLNKLCLDISEKMENFLQASRSVPVLQMHVKKVQNLLNIFSDMRRTMEAEVVLMVVKCTVEGLLEGSAVMPPDYIDYVRKYREMHFQMLAVLRRLPIRNFERTVTNCIFELRDELRYNPDIIMEMIIHRYINIQIFDTELREAMEHGINSASAIAFASALMECLVRDERTRVLVTESEFVNAIEFLTRLNNSNNQLLRNRNADLMMQLTESGLDSTGGIHPINHELGFNDANERQTREIFDQIQNAYHAARQIDREEIMSFAQKNCDNFLHEWITQFNPSNLQLMRDLKNFTHYVKKLNAIGVCTENLTRFIMQTYMQCIKMANILQGDQSTPALLNRKKVYKCIDAYVHLVVMILRQYPDSSKVQLINKILGIAIAGLYHDHETRAEQFFPLAHQRFLAMLFLELTSTDMLRDIVVHNVVIAFSQVYRLINPCLAPAFAYSWLDLISNRVFINQILVKLPKQKGWQLYAELLMDLFKFLQPFLRNAELAKPVHFLYKGATRVLLVLLNDFAELLCEHYFGFCDVIPPNCVQMRNLILSAFPRSMRLPDPFTPELRVDALRESNVAPKVCNDYVANITPESFKERLDTYLKERSPVVFLSELRSQLQISDEPGQRYNIPLMNALVLYVGTQAIAVIRNTNSVPNMSNIASNAHMDILQNLAVDLDYEGRYLFFNSIANQLRYPNSHTHYFSCAVLYLFAEANSEAIQEQITRVLVERLIGNRPHPWGLLVTFIELIRNQGYKFWEHEFVQCAPEITKLARFLVELISKKIAKTPRQGIKRCEDINERMTVNKIADIRFDIPELQHSGESVITLNQILQWMQQKIVAKQGRTNNLSGGDLSASPEGHKQRTSHLCIYAAALCTVPEPEPEPKPEPEPLSEVLKPTKPLPLRITTPKGLKSLRTPKTVKTARISKISKIFKIQKIQKMSKPARTTTTTTTTFRTQQVIKESKPPATSSCVEYPALPPPSLPADLPTSTKSTPAEPVPNEPAPTAPAPATKAQVKKRKSKKKLKTRGTVLNLF